ncbi:MAG: hypothetical protein ACD_67C00029G0002 [uncultured bacterium]|nr:MAG: hypothetical protein ACD_67C00029G0002 [uncultured bacterium]
MLVIGAVGLSVVVSLVLLGIDSSRSSLSLEQGNKAKALANACAEVALERIWKLDIYTGSENLTIGQGTCSWNVSSVSIPKTITASGAVGENVRKVSITIDQLHPYLHVLSWREIP